LASKIKTLFDIQDHVGQDSEAKQIKVTNELLTPIAGLPIKKGFKCNYCSATETFYSTSKRSMIEHFSRKHSKNNIDQEITTLLQTPKYEECYVQSLSLKSKRRCFGVAYIEANYIQGDGTSTQLNVEERRQHVTDLLDNFGSNVSTIQHSMVHIPNPFLKTLQWLTIMESKNWQLSRAIVNIEPIDNFEKLLIICVKKYTVDANEMLKSASYNLRELVGKETG
jgi:hypothetical protein